MQEVYCFILPFILKWLVAALVASVLVSLFSRLRRQGDRSSTTIYAQIRALFNEWLQSMRHHVLSNKGTLLILVRLIGGGRVSGKDSSKVTRCAENDHRTVENEQCWHDSPVFGFLGISACMFQHHVASRLYCAVLDHPDSVVVMSQKLYVDFCFPYFQARVAVRAQVFWSACQNTNCQVCCGTMHRLCAPSRGATYTSNHTGQIHACYPEVAFTRQSTLHAVQMQACMHLCMDFV